MAGPFDQAFVGRTLTKAEILEAQVNFYFPQCFIAVYNPITIHCGSAFAHSSSPEFPAMLELIVGETLQSIEVTPNNCLALVLESGARIEISTEPGAYSGPEALSARGPNGELFVVQ